MKESGSLARKMVKENSSGPMARSTKENSKTTNAMDKASFITQMVNALKACGGMARSMVKQLISGLMVPSITSSTLTGRNKGKACLKALM